MANANEAYGILEDAFNYVRNHDGVRTVSLYVDAELPSATIIVTHADGTRFSQSITADTEVRDAGA